MLKREFVKKFGHNDKVFILRCGFDKKDDPNRKITTMEQLTVTTFAFPRSIKRIKESNGKYINDFCHYFDLRMKKIKPRERSNGIY